MAPVPACRPLVLGRREGRLGEEWCVASEDCAFGPIGFERVRDVRPGEMVIITPDGKLVSRQCAEVRRGAARRGARRGRGARQGDLGAGRSQRHLRLGFLCWDSGLGLRGRGFRATYCVRQLHRQLAGATRGAYLK
jgi:hypothetical protein